MDRFAICAIFKNEAPFLQEWIAHHQQIGIDAFFLYDNGSADGDADRCPSMRPPGVEVVPWPIRPGQQAAYEHCIRTHAASVDWIAFIDIDEFIHPLLGTDIRDVVDVAENHAAVLLHWLVFGPNGHSVPPTMRTTEAYDARLPAHDRWNAHVKSIVRANRVEGYDSPHTFKVSGAVCNARGDTIPNVPIQNVACHDRAVINHYYTRSASDWARKAARGRATTENPALQRTQAMFDYCAAHANVHDPRIRRLTIRPAPVEVGRPSCEIGGAIQGDRDGSEAA